MRFADLQLLVQGDETAEVEFKRSTGRLKEAGEALCAFLNGSGGRVLIGVDGKGEIVGQKVADDTRQKLGHLLQEIEPPPPVEVHYVNLPGSDHQVIVLDAARRPDLAPFTFRQRPYRRLESTTVPMPKERYEQLLLQQMQSRHRWESMPAEGVDYADLDHERIRRTVRLGVAAGRLPESAIGDEPVEALRRFGLLVDGGVNNAAVALFADFETSPQLLAYYPQCLLQLARFKGTDKTEFLDEKQVRSGALALFEAGEQFLMRHLPIAARILPDVAEREERPLFPPEALREALVNALCHRDYGIPGGSVRIAIYDDRLEIWSDGGLPHGMTVEDLKRNHESKPRNPTIAGVFYKRKLVEQWGRGTQRIVELCVAAGHPEPEFVERNGAVGVHFLPSGYVPPSRVSQDLTDRQREILRLLASAGDLPLREIVAGLKESPPKRTAQDDLARLRDMRLVQSVGYGRGAVYRLMRGEPS